MPFIVKYIPLQLLAPVNEVGGVDSDILEKPGFEPRTSQADLHKYFKDLKGVVSLLV